MSATHNAAGPPRHVPVHLASNANMREPRTPLKSEGPLKVAPTHCVASRSP